MLYRSIEEYRAKEMAGLTDARLEEDVRELHRAIGALEAERLRRVAELDRRRCFARDGHRDMEAWLVGEFRVDGPVARLQVRTARVLQEMPAARDALAQGKISADALDVLARAREEHPDDFGRDEALLLEQARSLPVGELRRSVAAWRIEQDTETAKDDAQRLRQARRLRTWVLASGMVRVDGQLDQQTGECVITALGAVKDAWVHSSSGDEERTPAQMEADALGEIARRFLDCSDRPSIGGERPHLVVTVPLTTLTGTDSAPPSFEHTGAFPPALLEHWGCSPNVTRVVLGPGSVPLDIGRTTRVVPAHLHRALVVRDGGCAWPGCGLPPSWCDPHHILDWIRGGPTALTNLVLLCRRHHTMIHEQGFGVRMAEGRPVFSRPDGSVIQTKALVARPDESVIGDRGPPMGRSP